MPKWLVYQTTNLTNGKIYVGVCRADRTRADGYLGSGTLIRAAVEKYGPANFERTTLIECETADEAYLIEAAIVDEKWCDREDTYNLKTGGMGGRGFAMSDEAKEKIRQSRLGKPHPPETNAKISESLSGRTLTDEHRKNISEAMKHANRGRPVGEETRKLLSERQKQAWKRGRKPWKGDAT
jgi:group I intron endonuclease